LRLDLQGLVQRDFRLAGLAHQCKLGALQVKAEIICTRLQPATGIA
jgi:hypothetical protein